MGDITDCKLSLFILNIDDEPMSFAKSIYDELLNYLTVSGMNKIPVKCLSQSLTKLETDLEVQCLREYFLELLRIHHLHRNERELLLTDEDQLVAVQLCLAEQNKRKNGDFNVEVSKVVAFIKRLEKEKLRDWSLGQEETVLNSSLSTLLESSFDQLESTSPVTALSTVDEEYQSFKNIYKEFCCINSVLDPMDLLTRIKEDVVQNASIQQSFRSTHFLYLNQGVHTLCEKAYLEFLGEGRAVKTIKVVQPLESSPGKADGCIEKLIVEDCTLDELMSSSRRSADGNARKSVTETFVEKIMLGYLSLMINSRSELALARVINVPDRDLDHRAFNDVKKEAQAKNLSMFQVSSSFVMRIRLGGKSYAPNSSHRLAPHVKGLSDFTDLMHKLQTVIEEDSDSRSAIRKVLCLLKNTVAKCPECRLRKQSVDDVRDRLMARAEVILGVIDATKESSPKRNASAGGSLLGRRTLKVIRCLLDQHNAQPCPTSPVAALTDVITSQRTPVRFQSLLSKFRSPVEHSPDAPESLSLSERMKIKKNKAKKRRLPLGQQSSYEWAKPAHDSGWNGGQTVNTVMEDFIPSKTIVHAAPRPDALVCGAVTRVLESLRDQENTDSHLQGKGSISGDVAKKRAPLAGGVGACQPGGATTGAKRSFDAERGDGGAAKRAKTDKKSVPKKTRKTKNVPLQKGQKTLGAFFRI